MDTARVKRGQAFTIMFDKPTAVSSNTTPRQVGQQSRNSRVSVSNTPRRGSSFKFLRKDEGKKAADARVASAPPEGANALRNDGHWCDESKALREAIAADMRNNTKDPFADITIAMPHRAPPTADEPRRRQETTAAGEIASEIRSKFQSGILEKEIKKDTTASKPPWVPNIATSSTVSVDDDVSAKLNHRNAIPIKKNHNTNVLDALSENEETIPKRKPCRYEATKDEEELDDENEDEEEMPQRRSSRVGGGRPDLMQTVMPLSRKEQHKQKLVAAGIPYPEGYDEEYTGQHPAGSSRVRFSSNDPLKENRDKSQSKESLGLGYTRKLQKYVSPRRNQRYADEEEDDEDGDNYPDPVEQRQNRSSHSDRRSNNSEAMMAETELMEALEQERRECEEERNEYTKLLAALENEKERFKQHKYIEEQRLQNDKNDIENRIADEKRQKKAEIKAIEERCRQLRENNNIEREANRRLKDENESLREQVDNLIAQRREQDRNHRAEIERLKVEIAALTSRNADLIENAKASQTAFLQQRQKSKDPLQGKVLTPSPENNEEIVVPRGSRRDSEVTASSITTQENIKDEVTEERESENARKRREARERRARDVEERLAREEREREEKKRIAKIDADKQREEERQRAAEKEERLRKLKEEEERQRKDEERQRAAEKDERQKRMKEEEERRHRASEEVKLKREQEEEAKRRRQQAAQVANAVVIQQPQTAGKSVGLPPSGKPPAVAVSTSSQAAKLPTGLSRIPPGVIPSAQELVADDEPMPPESLPDDEIVQQKLTGSDNNKREVTYRSGKKEIFYSNGTKKVVLPTGHIVLYFTNGDIKKTFPTGKSTYWYEVARTTHTQLPTGTELFQFHSSNQTERHHPDGTKEILYPEGIFKVMFPDGTEKTLFPDGTTHSGQ